MNRRQARALAASITTLIDENLPGDTPMDHGVRVRLHARVIRHLPLPGAPEGSPLWPPAYGFRVCTALGLNPALALDFAAAGAFFFAAADLADDLADGDVTDTANGINDVCRLLFLSHGALLTLDGVEPEVRSALAQAFAAEGQTMARGQELDLGGTNALDAADPVQIATLKSGAEFALFTAGPARLAGLDPAPFADFGRAFGCLGQTLSDAFDLFLDPEGDDWTTRKPTFALRHGLQALDRAPLGELVSGACEGADRRAAGLWHLVRLGAGTRLGEIRDACAARMDAAATMAAQPILATLRDELVEWTTGVCEALHAFGLEPEPKRATLEVDLSQTRHAVQAFLGREDAFADLVRTHRWGLLNTPEVRDSRLGPLVVAELLSMESAIHFPQGRRLVSQLPADGWSRFDVEGAPRCTETTARTIRLAVRLGLAEDSLAREACLVLKAHQRKDGLFPPWLGGRKDPRVARFVARWGEGPCPVQSSWAALALWSVTPKPSPAIKRASRALSDLFTGDRTPDSPFYGPLSVEMAGARTLRALRPGLDAQQQGAVDGALACIRLRTLSRRRLDGLMGDALETAQGGWLLHHLGALPDPSSVVRALVDLQDVDGGYPPGHFRRDWGPRGKTNWWGPRTLTTAFVHRFLTTVTS